MAAALLMAALSASCAREPRDGNAAQPTPQAGAAASPIPWKTIEPPTQVGAADSGTPNARQTPAPLKSYSGVGFVRSIHLEEGWLEIDHEEIKDFMPAMLMQWSVRNRAMLKSVRVGDKVNFTVEDNNGTEFVTELKRAPAAP
jgi:Cu/Ag efflux protein CusF